MAELANDLPRVDVPSSAHEPFLSTTHDQNYMINEIVKTHRVRTQSRRLSSGNDSTNDYNENEGRESDERLKVHESETKAIPIGSLRKRSPPVVSGSLVKNRNPFEDGNFSSSSSFSTTSTDDEAEKERKRSKLEPLKIVKDMELDEVICYLCLLLAIHPLFALFIASWAFHAKNQYHLNARRCLIFCDVIEFVFLAHLR